MHRSPSEKDRKANIRRAECRVLTAECSFTPRVLVRWTATFAIVRKSFEPRIESGEKAARHLVPAAIVPECRLRWWERRSCAAALAPDPAASGIPVRWCFCATATSPGEDRTGQKEDDRRS